ncbi:MAG: nitrate ABC transporter permease [Rhodospirillaceae bacterium]|nr:nitrate ABC transporter permease [Rhodospirillaceae bacterium]
MTTGVAHPAGPPASAPAAITNLIKRFAPAVIGVAATLALWQVGGILVAMNPDTASFADFAPGPTFNRLWDILQSGEVVGMSLPSLERIGQGLLWAIVIGVPVGIAIGRLAVVREATHLPFQFLRMISPLAWMPIAVLAFETWHAAIVFLIFAAAVWPITFSTAAGLRKVDPKWFRVAQNLGARGWHMLAVIILPAIAQDVLTGIRLALGVAWVVLVPAEYLGVTSGLGYAINDARDTLEYDRITAIVLIIGAIGFALDAICLYAIRRYSWVRNA